MNIIEDNDDSAVASFRDHVCGFCINYNRLVHVHIPKTGGTSVNRFFKGCPFFFNAEHSSAVPNYKVKGKVAINSPLSGKANNWPCFLDYTTPFDLIFVVTRNPFSWLVSYYHHIGSSRFGFFKHKGWQGVVDLEGFKSFDYFVNSYLASNSGDCEWHFPPLSRGPLGQVYDEDGVCFGDLVLTSEALSVTLPIVHSCFKNDKSPVLSRLNVNPNSSIDYRGHYSSVLVDRIFSKWPDYFEQTRYGFESTFVSNSPCLFVPLNKGC